MRRTEVLKEIRRMRFEYVYWGWSERQLSQEEAAMMLVVRDRTFRRYINRCEELGEEGLLDRRLIPALIATCVVDEVMAVSDLYKSWYRTIRAAPYAHLKILMISSAVYTIKFYF